MATTREIFEKVERKIKERSDELSDVRGVYKFELNGPEGGTWIVDLREETLGVRQTEEDAQCTFKASDAHFIALFTGKLQTECAHHTCLNADVNPRLQTIAVGRHPPLAITTGH